jgi:hypothetical protein
MISSAVAVLASGFTVNSLLCRGRVFALERRSDLEAKRRNKSLNFVVKEVSI